MKEYEINEWKDYGTIFEELIDLLNTNNQSNIALRFQDCQKYLNGLTDGWFDFLSTFRNVVEIYEKDLAKEQILITKFLITTLDNILKNR